ncbi:hypothetical protein EDB81DRAFT_751490 [Dactylonectria macrodidyma]|uniref:Zn(2)-C6 fungal-type domain-containing protein n=1 Tax=Dactylonectria macrodidyma TaxID=307937 RepID=A0A9P9FU84_9HYPO|nr:hypothetical protein EDB81DRAFT_751490 [Dactylonectria macrodidyma]
MVILATLIRIRRRCDLLSSHGGVDSLILKYVGEGLLRRTLFNDSSLESSASDLNSSPKPRWIRALRPDIRHPCALFGETRAHLGVAIPNAMMRPENSANHPSSVMQAIPSQAVPRKRIGFRKSRNGCLRLKPPNYYQCDEKVPCTPCIRHRIPCSVENASSKTPENADSS